MSTYFHGNEHRHSFFEGWYFKHQTSEHTLILIPAFHRDADSGAYATLQVILDEASHFLTFHEKDFQASADRLFLRLGQNIFSEKGCRLHLDLPDCSIRGHLYYGHFRRPIHSFMGPFRHLPLPCFHEVISLSHRLRGQLSVYGETWNFDDGIGYVEKDWGRSFPGHYLWIQGSGNDRSSSFMLTIADLSSHGRPLLACSSLISHDGKQYRLSTYQGARLKRYGARRIALRQGPYYLQIILPPEPTDVVALQAPRNGSMDRTIQEHPRCPIQCQLYKGKTMIFDIHSNGGSYELA